jgi:hypothetical protein
MKRILSLVVVALVVAAMVLLMAMTALANGKDNNAAGTKCSEATLDGRYLFSFDGYEINGDKKVPFAQAGYEVYDGNGNVKGVYSGNFGGEVIRNQPISGTYTVKANCTGRVRTDQISRVCGWGLGSAGDEKAGRRLNQTSNPDYSRRWMKRGSLRRRS